MYSRDIERLFFHSLLPCALFNNAKRHLSQTDLAVTACLSPNLCFSVFSSY